MTPNVNTPLPFHLIHVKRTLFTLLPLENTFTLQQINEGIDRVMVLYPEHNTQENRAALVKELLYLMTE